MHNTLQTEIIYIMYNMYSLYVCVPDLQFIENFVDIHRHLTQTN
jgi:hypothetical protein